MNRLSTPEQARPQIPITDGTWQRLYSLAEEIERVAPWEWMLEMDLFGVAHPQTGQIGFCSVLAPDNVRNPGLAIYKGDAGLFSYEFMQDWGMDIPGFGQVQEQHCLHLTFVEAEQLMEPEQQRLLRYGFRHESPLSFPIFRDYTPGWVPWPIQSEEEAIWIQVAMEQTLEVSARFRKDRDLLDHVEADGPQLLVRKPQTGRPDLPWQDDWISLDLNPQPEYLVKGDPIYLQSNATGLPRKQEKTWLVEYLYTPQPVYEEGERPCLPRLFFIVDSQDQARLGYRIVKPGAETRHLQALFMSIARGAGYLPGKVVVGQVSSMSFWGDICRILQVPLHLDREHPLFPRIRNDWFGSYAL